MRAQHTFPGATDSWLQRLLTWTPGQTDMIKTVALVLMVTDHTGLLLAGNNEVMRLLGRGCFPLFGLAWGMNLARHAEIRQSQLNSLWGWALVAQVSFMLIGYPWYTGNILFAFAVTGQDINDGGQYRCCAEFVGVSGAASERTRSNEDFPGSDVTQSPGYSPLRG